ncbi:Nn.00g081670.m01.CDS01 [Neocucurbitaria sp. VM-36]
MSSMTETRQSVFVSDGFSEPMSAQHNFANNFDLNNPERAMSEYQKIMHEHTKRQLSSATDSARRRSGSSNGSVSSMSS